MKGIALVGLLASIAACGRIDFQVHDHAPDTLLEDCTTASALPDPVGVALGETVEALLCPGQRHRFETALAAGDEVEAIVERLGPGMPTLSIRGETGIRAVETTSSWTSAFADRAGTYTVEVGGRAAAEGTPYRITVRRRAGRHVFIAPDGDDDAPGTFEQPWRTFTAAVPRLVPGDVLVLADGTYDTAMYGPLVANCPTHASGTSDQPIRITALSERRARISGAGGTALEITGCAWWTVEGLTVENADVMGASPGFAVDVYRASNVVLRRLLARFNNRYFNSHLIDVSESSDVLVEECELYDFHRVGVLVWQSQNVIVRRTFAASRGRADLPGGYASEPATRGDNGVQIGLSTNVIAENMIEEGNGSMLAFAGFGYDVEGARFYGTITLNNDIGLQSMVDDSVGGRNIATEVFDHVTIDSVRAGFLSESSESFGCTRCTSLRAGEVGWYARQVTSPLLDEASARCDDCLVVGSGQTGFEVEDQLGGWQLLRPHTYGNPIAFEPATAPEIVAPTSGDPELGGCLAYVPASSPLYATGVGARVTHRYEAGTLTDVPLWHPVTGAFACGAVVPGINDDLATSCIGVHERLHVGTPDCPLPYE